MPQPGAAERGIPASEPLGRAVRRLLWRVPLLVPLLATVGVLAAREGAGEWGWAVALAVVIPAWLAGLRRVAAAGALCAAVAFVTQQARSDCEAELHRLAASGRAVQLQGVVVGELSRGCILETHWLGVRVALRGEMPWRTGDRLRVVAERLPVQAPPVQGMFSAPEWMHRRAICENMACLSAEKTGESWGWSRLVRLAGQLRRSLSGRLMPPGTESDARRQVLCALVLGDKENSDYMTLELFRRSGCLHAFAVSGLHVGLVAAILWALLRLCRVPLRAGQYVLLGVVGLYVIATGLAVPALRAYLMLAVLMGGIILRRRSDMFNTWCFVALLILLIEPWQLIQPGFQLSFVVYGAICLGLHYGMADSPWFAPDSYIPLRIRTRGERLLAHADVCVRGAVVVALVAWLASLPFSAAQFHTVSPLSYLTNIALTPLLPVVMLAGLVALAAGQAPLLGAVCHWLALKAAGCLLWVVGLLGQYPGALLPTCDPAPSDSALVAALSYGKSFCMLGNPGLLVGDVQYEGDARYRVEPMLFHSGFTPALLWAPRMGADALRVYSLSWPHLQVVQGGASCRCFSSSAGEFRLYFPPPRLPVGAEGAQPIVLWVRPRGERVLYLGNAAMSTLESMPPEECYADIVILGAHPREPLLDAAILRNMSAERIIFLPSARACRIQDAELAPARVERLSEEQPLIRL